MEFGRLMELVHTLLIKLFAIPDVRFTTGSRTVIAGEKPLKSVLLRTPGVASEFLTQNSINRSVVLGSTNASTL